MKEIRIWDEFITLGQLLKKLDLVSTGGQAKFFLEEHNIYVNGQEDRRRGRKVVPGDQIEIEGYGTVKIKRN